MSSSNKALGNSRANNRMADSSSATSRMMANTGRATSRIVAACNNALSKMGKLCNNNSAAAHSSSNSADTTNSNPAEADLLCNKTADTIHRSRIFSSNNKGGIIINGDMEGRRISV